MAWVRWVFWEGLGGGFFPVGAGGEVVESEGWLRGDEVDVWVLERRI